MSMTCTPTLTLSVVFYHLRLNNVIITLQNPLHSPQKQNKTNNLKPTHFLYRRMAMTMQMMKTTARTGPTTHMSPSPASTGRASTTSSGVVTVSL